MKKLLLLIFVLSVSLFASAQINLLEIRGNDSRLSALNGTWKNMGAEAVDISFNLNEDNKFGLKQQYVYDVLKANVETGYFFENFDETFTLYTDLDEAMNDESANVWFYMGSGQMSSMAFGDDGTPEKFAVAHRLDNDQLHFKFKMSTEEMLLDEWYNEDPTYAEKVLNSIEIVVKFKKLNK